MGCPGVGGGGLLEEMAVFCGLQLLLTAQCVLVALKAVRCGQLVLESVRWGPAALVSGC